MTWPAPPEEQADQMEGDTQLTGPPARNLRPCPLRWINGRPIYDEDKQVPGPHLILRQFPASDEWCNTLIGVVRKADDDNSSVDTNDSATDKVYDSQWRLVPEKVKNYYLSNGTINMMDFLSASQALPEQLGS